ncbi:hypothetical protein TI04_13220 [Achromatium sp. WMS2]|nr:hypothetical protein TI04_13220 [Achromatium sp. WMS2]
MSNSELLNPFNPPLPTTPGMRLLWGGLHEAASSLAIANAALNYQGLSLVIAPDVHTATRLERELRFFLAASDLEVLQFPDWETLAYDTFSPLPELVSQRLLTLYRLAAIQHGVLIVAVATLLQRLLPKKYLYSNTLQLKVGEIINPLALYSRLEQAGYRKVFQVLTHGEYAVRGSLIDLFPMGSAEPLRIDLLDDQIDSMRIFDTETQKSLKRVAVCTSGAITKLKPW